mmetsp:Transcript_96338/g.272380  ORF Transcript_96338/g.272380 Transcript_96338/m.272380 type:complete len:277 (-) Transcript_96338:570-1400(-)
MAQYPWKCSWPCLKAIVLWRRSCRLTSGAWLRMQMHASTNRVCSTELRSSVPCVSQSKKRSGSSQLRPSSSKSSANCASCNRFLNSLRAMRPSSSAMHRHMSRSSLAMRSSSARFSRWSSCGRALPSCVALSMNMLSTMFRQTSVKKRMKKTKTIPCTTLIPRKWSNRSPQSCPPVVACNNVTMPYCTDLNWGASVCLDSEFNSPLAIPDLMLWTKYTENRARIKPSSSRDQQSEEKQPVRTSVSSLSSLEKRRIRKTRMILSTLKTRNVRRTGAS